MHRPWASSPLAAVALATTVVCAAAAACSRGGAGGNGDRQDGAVSGSGGSGGTGGGGGAGAGSGGTGAGPRDGGGDGDGGGDAGSYPVVIGPDGCPLVPALRLTRVAQLAQTAMLLAQAPGDPRIFIAERPGRILILNGGTVAAAPFLDIRASVAPLETERGLLSIALHPAFATNRRFYLVYTRAANDPLTPNLTTLGDLVLAEGTASAADPNRADPTLRILRTVPKLVRYHNGGMIAFGQDGMLYMSTGEDGRGYTAALRPSLQALDNPLGKILRIDVDDPAGRPPGNFATGDPHVWDYGLRNPWRFSFDRQTGDLYIGDVGALTWDEIIFEPRGSGQRNYGWPNTEGNHCSTYAPGCSLGAVAPAIHEIGHTGVGAVAGVCQADFEIAPAECNKAVLGGYVYRGRALPELAGRYFYGDYIHNEVRSLMVKDGAAACHADHTADLTAAETPIQGLVSFSEDAAGELYLLDIFANVYRIERQ